MIGIFDACRWVYNHILELGSNHLKMDHISTTGGYTGGLADIICNLQKIDSRKRGDKVPLVPNCLYKERKYSRDFYFSISESSCIVIVDRSLTFNARYSMYIQSNLGNNDLGFICELPKEIMDCVRQLYDINYVLGAIRKMSQELEPLTNDSIRSAIIEYNGLSDNLKKIIESSRDGCYDCESGDVEVLPYEYWNDVLQRQRKSLGID